MSFSVEKEVYNTIQNLVSDLNWNNFIIDIKPETVAGDNYLGVISNVVVRGLDEKGDRNQLNLIVKSSQKNEDFRKTINVHDYFEREIFIYTEVFPIFESFQKEKQIVEKFKSYPRLYKYSLVDINEALVMENMKTLGYRLQNRKEPLDYHHASLVMKEYGKLHALSFALRDQKPETFHQLADRCKKTFVHSLAKEEFREMITPYIEHAIKVLDQRVDNHIIQKLEKLLNSIMEILFDILDYRAPGKHSVIVHGDCWINNILYKYDNIEKPDMPSHVCILDWQLSCLGSPALDLSYFLFTSTDSKLREQYFDLLLEQYYESLSYFLNELGSDPKVLFPWDIFQKHMKKFSLYGLMMSVMVIRLMLTDKEDCIDFSKLTQEERVKAAKSEIKNSNLYEERIRGLLRDFCKYKYF